MALKIPSSFLSNSANIFVWSLFHTSFTASWQPHAETNLHSRHRPWIKPWVFSRWVLFWEANSTLPSRTHVSHASGRGALIKKVKALEAFPVPDLRHSHLECFRASMGWRWEQYHNMMINSGFFIPRLIRPLSGTPLQLQSLLVAICSDNWGNLPRIQWLLKLTPKTSQRVLNATPDAVLSVTGEPRNALRKHLASEWQVKPSNQTPRIEDTSTQSFGQPPRYNIQGHGMSLLKCCTKDMTLYSDTSQGDVYM